MSNFEFVGFPKMARLSRECVITEKIDGTNASVFVAPREIISKDVLDNPTVPFLSVTVGQQDFVMLAGSRTRWISAKDDNYGFGRWVSDNREELVKLGIGHHFGEWWGAGIQRRYGLTEKRFSLFNVGRWQSCWDEGDKPGVIEAGSTVSATPGPACCHVVPTLYRGPFNTSAANDEISYLRVNGSKAAPGFLEPEGIVVWHKAGKVGFKKTIIGDEKGKAQQV